jgi:hypothetical protein
MVEFCMSLLLDNRSKQAYVWYTVMDSMPSMARVDLESIQFRRVE